MQPGQTHPPLEKGLALLALLLPPILAWADAALLHPGFSAIDELAALRQAWEAGGRGLEPTLFSGALGRALLLPALRLLPPGPLSPLAPITLAWFLESLLLYLLARRLFSERAALGALLFNGLAALTLVRLRTVFSWSYIPLEAYGVLALLLLPRGHAALRSAAAGMLLALFAFDYEASAALGLGLLLSLPALKREAGVKPLAFCLGLAAGMGLVLWASLPALESYLAMRRAFTLEPAWAGLGFGMNLLAFAFGFHPTLPGLGLHFHPAIPVWGWALLAFSWGALRRGQGWILACAACGLLPLLLPSAGLSEANRGAAAWPFLCLAAAAGFGRLAEHPLYAARHLLFLCGLGALLEVAAFQVTQKRLAPDYYAQFQSQLQAARELGPRVAAGEARLLSHLGATRASEMEWLLGAGKGGSPAAEAPAPPGGGPAARTPAASPGPAGAEAPALLAPLPAEALPAAGEKAGAWRVYEALPGAPKAYVLEPAGEWAGRLARAEAALELIDRRLGARTPVENLAVLKAALDQDPQADPWVRTVLWQKRMTLATILGRCDAALVDELLKEKLVHSGPLRHPAAYMEKRDPALALRMKEAMARLDRAWKAGL